MITCCMLGTILGARDSAAARQGGSHVLSLDKTSIESHVVRAGRGAPLGGRGADRRICLRMGAQCLLGGSSWQKE